MKNGTRLWREAHLRVKMLENTSFAGDILEVPMFKNAAVARSTFASQNVAPHSRSIFVLGAILEVPMFKNGTRLWREAFASENAQNTTFVGAILEVPMFKNGTRLWREAYL